MEAVFLKETLPTAWKLLSLTGHLCLLLPQDKTSGEVFFFSFRAVSWPLFFLLINSAIYWVVLLSHQLLRPDPLYAVPCARGVANMNRAQNKAAGNLRIFRQTTGKMS